MRKLNRLFMSEKVHVRVLIQGVGFYGDEANQYLLVNRRLLLWKGLTGQVVQVGHKRFYDLEARKELRVRGVDF